MLGEVDVLTGFAEPFFRTLLCWLQPLSGQAAHVLEPGAGTGRFSRRLARLESRWQVVALDSSEESRKFYEGPESPENLRFVQADLFHMPFGDGEFDAVFNEGVIEHFTDYPAALWEMSRVLRPGGIMVVSVPNIGNIWHTRYKRSVGDAFEYGYEKSFSMSELREALREVGVSPVHAAGFDPAYGLARLESRGVADARARAGRVRWLQRVADRLSGGSFSRLFGFEIAVAGYKR